MGLFKPNVEKMEKEKNIKGLIKTLHNKRNCRLRVEALNALGRIGDVNALEPLIEILNDDNDYWKVRSEVASALGKIGDASAIEPLNNALKDDNEFVRNNALKALKEIEDSENTKLIIRAREERDFKKLEYLITTLENKELRRYIIFGLERLAKTGESKAIRLIIQALKDKGVQLDAKKAIEEIGEPAVKPLIKEAKDSNYSVQGVGYIIIELLAKTRDKRAVEPLIMAFENVGAPMEVVYALEEIGDKRAIGVFSKILEKTGRRGLYGQEKMRESAARALSEFIDERAIKPLIEALKDLNPYSHVRRIAIKGLAKIGPAAVDPLIKALKNESYEWDYTISAPDGYEPATSRSFVIKALGEIGDDRAVKSLTHALEHKHRDVRLAAQEALRKIKTKNNQK